MTLLGRLRARLYPPQPGPGVFESCCIEAALGARRVLDFGAGRGAHGGRHLPAGCFLVGADPSLEVGHNEQVDAGVVFDGARLPFGDGVFDACMLRWVVEHLPEPVATFREIRRVLRPGGRIVILTSNLYYFGYLVARLIPNRLHPFLVKRLTGREERDTFPTRYRANTPAALERALAASGFRKRRLFCHQRGAGYLDFSLPTFLFGWAYDRAVNGIPPLWRFRQGLLADFEAV